MKKLAALVVVFVFTLTIAMAVVNTAKTTITPKSGHTYSLLIAFPPPGIPDSEKKKDDNSGSGDSGGDSGGGN